MLMFRAETSVAGLGWARRGGAFLLKLGITAGLLWFVLHKVNIDAIAASFARIRWEWFAAALMVFALTPLLGGVRWWVVFRAIGRSACFADLTSVFWVGMAMNQIMPAAMSDGIRVLLLARRGYRASDALSTIILERVAMLLALLVMVVVTVPLIETIVAQNFPIWIPASMLSSGVFGIAVLLCADRDWGRIGEWRVVRAVVTLSVDARHVLKSRYAVALLTACFASNLNFVIAGMLLGIALGLVLPWFDWFAVIPLVVVVTVLPVSVGGWGVREGLLVVLLGAAAVPAQQALAFSLLFGGLSAISSLPGLALLWSSRSANADAGEA